MSYTDGIGNLRQALTSIASAETKPSQKVSEADAKQSAVDGAISADQAQVSTAGGFISKAMEHSDVRMEKVQALRQTIASGSYQVSSSDVADKLIKALTD